ncbi:LptF/LptG family permease [Planctomycetota bacterium]
MKLFSRLNRYILRETAITYIFTVASFLFLMYTATFLKQMEMGLPLGKIIMHSPYIFFINLPFVLPLGLITGYILTFSRLAVDREIQIIRASGIPLSQIIIPHLVLGLLMSFLAGYAFLEWIPRIRRDFQQKLVSMYRDIPPVTETYNKPSLLLNRKRDRINVTARDGTDIKGLAIQHVEKRPAYPGDLRRKGPDRPALPGTAAL